MGIMGSRQNADKQVIKQEVPGGENVGADAMFNNSEIMEEAISSAPPNQPDETVKNTIMKIPKCLTRNNHNSYGYKPKIVSIGPYHHGDQQLQWIQGHKKSYQEFLSQGGVVAVESDLKEAVKLKIQKIKDSYSEYPIRFKDDELIQMMVDDGCFLLGLFMKNSAKDKQDLVFSTPWVLSTIQKDLILLENQLPLFILQTLLDTAKPKTKVRDDLNGMALKFFSNRLPSSCQTLSTSSKQEEKHPQHLLDLVRESFICVPPPTSNSNNGEYCCANPKHHAKQFLDFIREIVICIPVETQTTTNETQTTTNKTQTTTNETQTTTNETQTTTNKTQKPKLNSSTQKLRTRGIKFKVKRNSHSFLDISFSNGVIQIPEIVMDDFMSLLLLNCIAFEQLCANSGNDDITCYAITCYAMFMGSLMANVRDASFLVEEGIIENYYGTDNEVARFFRRITKDYVFEIEKSYLKNVFDRVKKYADSYWNGFCAGFRYTYLGSPWLFASTLGALLLIVLTIMQVYYASKA